MHQIYISRQPTCEPICHHLSRVAVGRDGKHESTVDIIRAFSVIFFPIAEAETPHTARAHALATSIPSQTTPFAQGGLLFQESATSWIRGAYVGHRGSRPLHHSGAVVYNRATAAGGIKVLPKSGVVNLRVESARAVIV